MIRIECARFVCDQCGKVGDGVIISDAFEDQITDSIQLCFDHAKWLSEELAEESERNEVNGWTS